MESASNRGLETGVSRASCVRGHSVCAFVAKLRRFKMPGKSRRLLHESQIEQAWDQSHSGVRSSSWMPSSASQTIISLGDSDAFGKRKFEQVTRFCVLVCLCVF